MEFGLKKLSVTIRSLSIKKKIGERIPISNKEPLETKYTFAYD